MNKKILKEEDLIIIKNPYPADKFIEDVKEQIEIFGKKEIYLDFKRTSKYRYAYLPTYTIRIWKRHLIMNLPHLYTLYREQPHKVINYMYNKFGKNWILKRSNNGDTNIALILLKDAITNPLSQLKNYWKVKGSVWDNKLILTKIDEINQRVHSEKEIGKGLLYEISKEKKQ